ncbi:MAG: AbrB family transcriptional regulator, partial [Anderseniella sp.]
WLAGSVVTVAAASLSGIITQAMPKRLSRFIFILLGLQIGGSVTPETLNTIARWPLSFLVLALTMAVLVWLGMVFFRKVYGWDKATSFFAVMPGALSVALALAADTRADLVKVSVSQVTRLFILVAVLPSVISSYGSISDIHPPLVLPGSGGLRDLVMVLGAGLVAGFVFEKLKVPAGLVLGPALASAVMHIGEVVHGTLPLWVLVPVFVFLGTMIGMRFSGVRPRDLMKLGGASLTGLGLAMVISVAGAAVASRIADVPLAWTVLAFAPGGMEAMTIMAFALNLDPAFVGAHQIGRFVLIALAMPLVWYMLKEKPAPYE